MGEIVDRPEELQHDLLHRSFTMRMEAGQAPRWESGWPLAAHGWLPGGQPWAIVFGRDAEGPAADFSVSTSRCNICIQHACHLGSRGVYGGELNQHHAGGTRSLCWLTNDAVDELELDTDQGPVSVPWVYGDEQLGVRVYLAVVEDETVSVHEARHLDHDGRVLVVEDLVWAQQGFASDRAEEREGARRGNGELLTHDRPQPGSGATFHIFGSPTGRTVPPPDRT